MERPLPELALAGTEPGDLAAVLDLEADPDVAPWILAWPRERHLRAITEPDEAHLTFSGVHGFAGFALLAGLSGPERSIELRRIALVRRGRGAGWSALQLVLGEAFHVRGAKRVWLDVVPGNAPAIRLYEEAGFRSDGPGEMTHLLPGGGLERLRVMSISAGDWAPARPRPAVA